MTSSYFVEYVLKNKLAYFHRYSMFVERLLKIKWT